MDEDASHAFQLAPSASTARGSLYWYDRPPGSPPRTGGAGGAQTVIGDKPELEFYDRIPTVWDETKVLAGKIGEFAVIARRSGQDWPIGGMNSGAASTLELPLNFLTAEKLHLANIYSDDSLARTPTQVRIDRSEVDSEVVFTFSMSPQGGKAVHLTPAAPAK